MYKCYYVAAYYTTFERFGQNRSMCRSQSCNLQCVELRTGKLREDLFKKFASADGIAGRKPYGFRTRMIHCKGWKRLEANRMFTFEDVDQRNFNSIMRRSLVWRCKARFEDPHVIEAAYSDIGQDGVFKKDPDLEAFLTSGPAVAAGLQLQHAFEMEHSKDECVDMIEQYVSWGGDYGLTETTMRKACKLPPRDVRDVTSRAGAVIQLDDPDEDKEEADKWTAVRFGMMEFLLTNKKVHANVTAVRTFKCVGGPNVSKGDLLDGLVARRFAMKCAGVGRGAPQGATMPLISAKTTLESIVDHRNLTCNVELPEVYDIAALDTYLHGCMHRRENVEILAETWQRLSKQRLNRAGRPDPYDLHKKEKMQEKAAKLLQAEKDGDKLLEKFKGPSPKRRRVKGAEEDVKVEGSREITCSYHYSGLGTARGRKHVDGTGAQKFTRRVQQILLPDTHDLDIENAIFTIMPQLLNRLELEPRMPEDCWEALRSCWTDRAGVCSKLGMSTGEGKHLLVSMFFGAGCPKSLQKHDFVHEFQKAAIFCKWVAAGVMPEEYKTLQQDEKKKNPEASLLSHLYFACEDFLLTHWLDFLQTTMKPRHVSLHFDGVRIASMPGLNVEDLCRQCEKHIQKSTGFDVHIREKKHRSILQLLRENAANVENPKFESDHVLRKAGNCIPHSIACLQPLDRDKEVLLQDDGHPGNVHMQHRGCRTYQQCMDMLGCNLSPILLIDGKIPTGGFLLHVENGGAPHCVAVRRDESNANVTVWENDCVLHISHMQFSRAVLEGTDHSTCAFFGLGTDIIAMDDGETTAELHLLGMSAGAPPAQNLDESDDEEFGPRVGEAPSIQGFEWLDDQGQVTVEAVLLEEMKKEIAGYIDKAKNNAIKPHQGAYACPACAFRSFDRCSRVAQHLSKYHTQRNQFSCSGTKQLRVALAIHDADMLAQQRKGSYLQRSAQALRNSIRPKLSPHINAIDRSIRLLLDASGPKFVHVDSLVMQQARQVGRLWYTHAFAERIFQEMLLQHGKAPMDKQVC